LGSRPTIAAETSTSVPHRRINYTVYTYAANAMVIMISDVQAAVRHYREADWASKPGLNSRSTIATERIIPIACDCGDNAI
jgi:hypothetical protein